MTHDKCKAAIIIFLGINLGNGLEKLRKPEIQDGSRLSFLIYLMFFGASVVFKVGLCQT